MTIESTMTKVNHEITAGRLWRAKEILQSSARQYGHCTQLMRKLAEVLSEMGDDLEAGKFFLLSVDNPTDRETEAIQTFLARYDSLSYKELLAKFPAYARLCRRSQYPAYLQTYLEKIGAPAELRTIVQPVKFQPTFSIAHEIGCLFLVGTTIMCTIIGAYTILRWIMIPSPILP